MAHKTVRCDIFCRVIDNYGDAGVCWRLARQLAAEADWSVRLIIDAPHVLARLEPAFDERAVPCTCRGVEIVLLDEIAPASSIGSVVIEAFGCRLPDSYRKLMTTPTAKPVWINLEYLSAEEWVEDCHALPSPDPATGVVKYFFFPGFASRTGGLLRERWHAGLLQEFSIDSNRRGFLEQLGIVPRPGELVVSLFCYPESGLMTLFNTSLPKNPVRWLVSEAVAGQPGHAAAVAGHRANVSIIPFLPQDDYDRLLMACDVNFVRGEDSFIRAQWALRPFIWQAYRQEATTRETKVDAFLERYLELAPPEIRATITRMWKGWNGIGDISRADWIDFAAHRRAIEAHNARWANELSNAGNLAERLVGFCEIRL